MKRTTKTRRLQMVVDEYNRRNPGPFTMEAVAEWAVSRGLWPTPGRTLAEAEEAAEWDERFAAICSEPIEGK